MPNCTQSEAFWRCEAAAAGLLSLEPDKEGEQASNVLLCCGELRVEAGMSR